MGLIMGLLGPVAVAQADTNTSLNWSGYAVHRHGVKFRRVAGEWREPTGTCQAGSDTSYSAFWVGLGGYRLNSRALEQIGTEFDCTPSGQAVLSAWYELVPYPSRKVTLAVNPGDLMRAKVKVAGAKVTVSLRDLTTGHSFRRTITDRYTDISSAEWIAEAPSECLSVTQCQVLPLADFGAVGFTRVFAQTTKYARGGIASAHWNHTKIVLANTNGRRYVSGTSPTASATPGELVNGGRAFTITYAGSTSTLVTPSERTRLESARTQPRITPRSTPLER